MSESQPGLLLLDLFLIVADTLRYSRAKLIIEARRKIDRLTTLLASTTL